MAASLTAIALTKLLTPLISDIYNGASGKVKDSLKKWAATTGLKKTASALFKVEKVKTIWSPEKEVSLNSFYYPSKLLVVSDEDFDDFKEIENKSIEGLPEGNLVIEGIVGQGKSIFMRHLAASTYNTSTPRVIPLFLELRTISTKRGLKDLIFLLMESLGITGTPDVFSYLASSKKLVLLLDGFDEIPSELVTDTILEIDEIQTKHPELKIIISSRPRHHIQNVVGFQVLHLARLSTLDYDPFISKLIPSSVKRFEVVEALNDCSDGIKGVISTPLMLTLVVIVYQTEKEIPATLSEFFEKLFGIVFTKHDKLKAGFNRQHHTKLSERKLRQLFDSFCFVLVQLGGGRSVESKLFEQAFDSSVAYFPECKCELEDFRNDIIKVACLMVEEGLDTTTFLHKSILEYHAAAFVKSQPDSRARNFYKSAFSTYDKWYAILEFLESIDTVRYSKYYMLECVSPLVDELSDLLLNREESAIVEYIEKYSPDITYVFDGDVVEEFGSESSRGPHFINHLNETIIYAILDDLEDPEKDDLFKKTVKLSNKRVNERRDHVFFQPYIKYFGLHKIKSSLIQLEYEHSEYVREAREKLFEEASKENIFDDLLTTNASVYNIFD